MATSAIPAAIDYLVAQIAALPECAAPVVVSDGWPTQRGATGVAVGVTPEDDDTESEPVYSQLGAQMEMETFLVPCVIWATAAGTNAQKAARDGAFAIWNAVTTKVRSDRTLGGALHSGAAIVTGVAVLQTDDPEAASDGRQCEIRCNVKCTNRF